MLRLPRHFLLCQTVLHETASRMTNVLHLNETVIVMKMRQYVLTL